MDFEQEISTDNFSDFILTRNLYVYDEVGLSFVESILSHKPIEETLFWISELYHSGYTQKSWDLVWYIYLDFYFVSYPGFMKYIAQKHRLFTFHDLLSVVYNMNALKKLTPYVFLLRILSCNNPSLKENEDGIKPTVYKGRKPSWLIDSFPHESLHPFVRDLFTHRYESMVCHSLPKVETWGMSDDHIVMQFLSTLQLFYQVDDKAMDDLTVTLHCCFLNTGQQDDQDPQDPQDNSTNTLERTEMEGDSTKEEDSTEENVRTENEHGVDMVEEMLYRPYANYMHVLLAVVCLFEFSVSSPKSKKDKVATDVLGKMVEDVEGGDFATLYSNLLGKEHKPPVTAWSSKYMLKKYKDHAYLTWTKETFSRRVIYLGLPEHLSRKFEHKEGTSDFTDFHQYKTSTSITPFHISRHSFPAYELVVDACKNHWLYYATKSPIWYTRLSSYEYFNLSHDDMSCVILAEEELDKINSYLPYDPADADEVEEEEPPLPVPTRIDVCHKSHLPPKLQNEVDLIKWADTIFPNDKICESCEGKERLAVYLKYRVATLLRHQPIWF